MQDAVDGGGSSPVPDAEHLLRLPRDDWAQVLRHARAVMRDLEDHLVTPRIGRLRAVPSSKLTDGRSRRDLCRELAEGGPLWQATSERLAADPEVDLERLLSAQALAPATGPAAEPRDDGEVDERVHRLKERARDLKDERDDARRRADGLDARLRTERERLVGLREEVASLRAERDRLTDRLEGAATERGEALERLQRRHDAEIHELREELRIHRRRQQQREERRRRRRERRSVEEQADEEVEAYLESRRQRRPAEAGRPSRLPAGVEPGTAAAVDALLGRGRRVIVDGYNVTKQHRGHLDLEHQRRWLVVRAGELDRRRGVRCMVVFDGDAATHPHTGGARSARVVFTSGGTADDRIVQLVDELPPDEPVLVVTDDRELGERVAGRGADVVGTAPFLRYLA